MRNQKRQYMTQNTLTTGIIDYLSATSAELVKLLADHFWRVKPRYTTEPQDIEQICSAVLPPPCSSAMTLWSSLPCDRAGLLTYFLLALPDLAPSHLQCWHPDRGMYPFFEDIEPAVVVAP